MMFRAVFVALSVLVLGGCVAPPQAPVPFNGAALKPDAGRIGVAAVVPERADTYFPGAGCLLCIAFASAANSSLTAHANTLSRDDVLQFKDELIATLKKKNPNVVALPADFKPDSFPKASGSQPNAARIDFSSLKATQGINRLVVLHLYQLGFERTYSAYVPTSEPKAAVSGVIYMVNLETQQYEWFSPIRELKASDGAWDEPPKFPGLTNAYFQAIEAARQAVTKPVVP